MTAECSYGIEYPKFSDLGADEITLSREDPYAAVLFVHPDRAPKDDIDELRTAFFTFAAAASSMLEELRELCPDAAEAIEKTTVLPDEYAPITVVYAEIPDTDIAPCNSCKHLQEGICTSGKMCAAVWP